MKKYITLLMITVLMTACGTAQTTNNQNAVENKEEMTVEETVEESAVSSTVSTTDKSMESGVSTNPSSDGLREAVLSQETASTQEAASTADSNIESSSENEKGVLGVYIQTVTTDDAKKFGMPVGAYISTVYQGGAADIGGLKEGDIITEIEGHVVVDTEDVINHLAGCKAGDAVVMKVQHPSGENQGYQEKKVEVTLMKESDVPEMSSDGNKPSQHLDFDYCSEYSAANMPEGIEASFSPIEYHGYQIIVGRFIVNDINNFILN